MAYRDARTGEYVSEEFAKANPDTTVYVAGPKPEPEAHAITVEYFNTDDGIHLVCVCGWEKGLGFSPPVGMIPSEAGQHWKTVNQ